MKATGWAQVLRLRQLSAVRSRLGIAPNASSFRVGVFRTHLVTALLTRALGRELGVDTSVFVRVDDTNRARTHNVPFGSLLDEILDVGEIKLDNVAPELAARAQERVRVAVLRQSQRAAAYGEALAQLRKIGVMERADGAELLSAKLADEVLESRGFSAKEVVAEAASNARVRWTCHEKQVALTRSDGSTLWHLASVVDDMALGITLVVRGSDKINSVAVQERLRLLLSPEPARVSYVFVPRLIEMDRDRSRIAHLLASGIRASALRWFMAEPFLAPETDSPASFVDLDRNFDRLPRLRDSRFDLRRLEWMDRRLARTLPDEVAVGELMGRLGEEADVAVATWIACHYRRPLREQIDLHRRLTAASADLDYQQPPPGSRHAVQWLRSKTSGDASPVDALDSSLMSGVRWVLTGRAHGPNPERLLEIMRPEVVHGRLSAADKATGH